MSNFKVNYAAFFRNQKKSNAPEIKEPATTTNQQAPRVIVYGPPTDSKTPTQSKKDDADYLGVYKNIQPENLDYINLLIQGKEASSKEKGKDDSKKKGRPRAKSSVEEAIKNQAQAQEGLLPNSPQTAKHIAEIIVPSPTQDENDKPPSMLPDDDDGFLKATISPRILKGNNRKGARGEESYGTKDKYKNLGNNFGIPNDEKLFGRYFKEDVVVKRSLSVESIKNESKPIGRHHNQSTINNPGELGSYSLDKSPDASTQQDSKQSNISSKGDFLTNLGSYIDYFVKSENTNYKAMKAGQYFQGNTGKSHRSSQRDLEAASREIQLLKMQMEKMLRKMNEVLGQNKVLSKELKTANAKEEEYQQRCHKMKEQIEYLTQKNHRYKAKNLYIQKLYQNQRLENEQNLLSLKKVLAKSINVALEQKGNAYVSGTKEKNSQLKSVLSDNVLSKKDREKAITRLTSKEKKQLDIISDYASLYEVDMHQRSKDHRDLSKREGSTLLSPQASFSSNEEDNYEEQFSNRFSSSIQYENSSDEDFRLQEPHLETYRPNLNLKDHQIMKLTKEKLAGFINSEDVSFNGQNMYPKSTTKTSRSKQATHQKKGSAVVLPSYYLSRERQNNIPKQSHFFAQEQRSRPMRNEYEEAPSPNEGSEHSFSLHNSD